MSDEYVGYCGERELEINAANADAAIETALDIAGGFEFDKDSTVDESECDNMLKNWKPDVSQDPDAGKPGAWKVSVIRIGHSSEDRDGNEYSSDYVVSGAVHKGLEPFKRPDGDDKSRNWESWFKSLSEAKTLSEKISGQSPRNEPTI